MKIITKQKDKISLLHMSGSLDAETVSIFKTTANKIVAEGNYYLVLDLSDVAFIDSMGLGAMISLLRKVRAQKGDVKVCGLTSDVQNIFEITRLHHLFDVCADWKMATQKYEDA